MRTDFVACDIRCVRQVNGHGRHRREVVCLLCGGVAHVTTYVRFCSGTWTTGGIRSAARLWCVRTLSPTCSAMCRTAVRLQSAEISARGERTLQKRMGECGVKKMCVHICFFAMPLAPPRHQPPGQL